MTIDDRAKTLDDRALTLTTRKRRFVAALLETPTLREAAEAAGVSEPTGWRYLRDAQVRAELGRRTDALLTQAASGLASDLAEARQTLREIHRDADAPAGARVSAARAVTDTALRIFELVALADRVAALEERLGGEK